MRFVEGDGGEEAAKDLSRTALETRRLIICQTNRMVRCPTNFSLKGQNVLVNNGSGNIIKDDIPMTNPFWSAGHKNPQVRQCMLLQRVKKSSGFAITFVQSVNDEYRWRSN